MFYIGIDPGLKGGIGIIDDTGCTKTHAFTLKQLISICRAIEYFALEHVVAVEEVHAMPGQGVTSMFNFGKEYGRILGVLEAYNLRYQLVTPQAWKKAIGVTSDKKTSIQKAKELFPWVDLHRTPRCRTDHDGMAEALLIAEYARRKYKPKANL